MSDLLITALAAVVLLAVLAICVTEPGAGPRYAHRRRYHRAGLARHTVRVIETAPMPALETVPDAQVPPFAARTSA